MIPQTSLGLNGSALKVPVPDLPITVLKRCVVRMNSSGRFHLEILFLANWLSDRNGRMHITLNASPHSA
jgi:hypothetical protein